MNTNNDWEFIITLSEGDEHTDAPHPLGEYEELDATRIQLDGLEYQYKKHYDILRIKYYSRSLGYGAMKSSWVLEGKYLDETKRLLYGKQQ